MLRDQTASFALLLLNGTRGVDWSQPKLIHHLIVLFEDLSLKSCKAFLRIIGPSHIQSCLIVFQVRPGRYNSIDSNFKRGLEEESQGGFHCERIYFTYPLAIATPGYIPGEGRINVTIDKHNGPGF